MDKINIYEELNALCRKLGFDIDQDHICLVEVLPDLIKIGQRVPVPYGAKEITTEINVVTRKPE